MERVLATQQQEVAARTYAKARQAYENACYVDADAYQREASWRYEMSQNHLARSKS